MKYILVRSGTMEFDTLEELIEYAKIAYLKYPDNEIVIRTKTKED
jgi:hypothetical protein